MTRRETKRIIKILIVGTFFLVLAGYSAFRAKDLAIGPVLEILSPSTGSIMEKSFTEVSGRVKNISYLTLNGNKIFTDENGVFKERILLSYGYNTVTVEATDRFGRVTKETIQLVYK